MKILKTLLILPTLMMGACSSEDAPVVAEGETVEVSFNIDMPGELNSRADVNLADEVVCAVFYNGNEVLRETVSVAGNTATFEPTLVKGRTYDIYMWAMRKDAYNVADFRNITSTSAEFTEAFTGKTSVRVTDDVDAKTVNLKRPFAQLNVGISQEAWNYAVSTLKVNPTSVTATIPNVCYPAYNAVDGVVAGEPTTAVFTSDSKTFGSLTVNGVNYVQTNSHLVLCDETADVYFSVNYSDNGGATNTTALNVPFKANFRTNILGDILTGDVNFSIVMENAFAAPDNDYEIK